MDNNRIRCRAYFHFENRTGKLWQDSLSNWLQAEQEERALLFFEELGRRVRFVRDTFAKYQIPLKPTEGLSRALAEAESLAKGEKAKLPYSRSSLIQTANDAHVIYSFGGLLEEIVNAGLDISHQLSNLPTGTTDYGTPSTVCNAIYFKDFEFELFIASALIRHGIVPTLTPPGDPCGEIVFRDVRIEAKHPNSIGQLTKNLGKFHRCLEQIASFGVFAVALEDAMTMGDVSEFASQADYDTWMAAKRLGMEALGKTLIATAARLPRIAALVQTHTTVEIIDGGTTLRRLSNSVVFDHRPTFSTYKGGALAIASAFNPLPIHFSVL
jgi:hypothetical protein